MITRFLCQLTFILCLILTACSVQADHRGPHGIVRVGIFPVQPLNYMDKHGVAKGLYPDLLRKILKHESWTIEFVPGSWAEGLERLQKDEIDLLLSVAYSPERAKVMDFSNESVAELWGQVFVRPEGKSKNINDLAGRPVAIMRKDICGSNFISTAEKFGVHCKIVEFATHAEVFSAVRKGVVDAGVAPQHIGLRQAKEYKLVGSSIMFSPFSIYFASKKGTQHELLSHIDAQLSSWKKEPDSFYYDRLDYWLGNQGLKTKIPLWLLYASTLGVITILVFAGFSMLLKKTVNRRTREFRESEERYRAIIDLAVDGILLGSQKGIIIEANQHMSAITGLAREQLLGKHVSELPFAGEDVLEKPFRFDLLEKGETVINERTFIRQDGSEVFVEMRSRKMPDGTLQSFYRDITERKKMDKDLRKSEEQFRRIITTVREGILSLDAEWRITFANAHLAEMFGYELDELLGQSFYIFIHEDDLDDFEQRKHEREQGQYSQFERRFRTKEGRKIWTIVSASAFKDNEGHFAGSFGTITDITEQKMAEEALRESEARFKALHNASFGGICIHDKGIILDCNQSLSEMTGYSTDELIGMNGLLLISEKTREIVLNNILSGYEKPYEAIGVRKNNEEYPLRLEARNIPHKGKNVRTVEFRDITGQKQNEAEKRKLENQLQQAQRMDSIGQLAGGVAHDFNNMLGVIIGYSELILAQADPSEKFHTELEEIRKAAQRSAVLTRQLLTFARKQTVAPKVLDLNKAIEGALNILRRLIGENINLIWMPGTGLWPIMMDPSQIDQILANLCANARDAIAGIGKLTVETGNTTLDDDFCIGHAGSVPGEYVRIAVSDNGSGMDKETLAHIFEPFFTTKSVGEGTGLGLATVYGAVKQNNGYITTHSESGQGTTFTIYIPRHVEKTTKVQITKSAKPISRGDEIIMLVEDEPTLLILTKTMLERLGYTVLTAGTPNEAIRIVREFSGHIDLLATDLIMPEMNGRELAKKLAESRPEMKHLFISGYTANIIANQGVLKEGVSFIQKPFSLKQLADKIRAALVS